MEVFTKLLTGITIIVVTHEDDIAEFAKKDIRLKTVFILFLKFEIYIRLEQML
jgi:ABC-type lipoprotein export system ATPase subunit